MSERTHERPRQAVIVAGGRGTRLGPLTAARPKALLEVGGRPFIDWLIESLRDRGFDRFLLLLGYRAEMVVDHVRDGRHLGVSIDTLATDVEDETGRRFLAAREQLDERFLFAYCDNLWPMPWEQAWDQYLRARLPAQVVVYGNDDGFTRSNVRVDDGRVVAYDPTRTQPDLQGVEIGYAILERDMLGLLPDRNVSLQAGIYPRLIERGALGAFVTRHRYYSIGKPERLSDTERYVTGSPAVILDRDGVLNAKMPRAEYVRTWSEWRWMPGALDALRRLREAGYRTFIVSNQAGIARGAMTEQDLQEVHARMLADVEAAGGRIDGIYVCPHDWDAGCTCRKPEPGMLLSAQRDHALDLTITPFVGDDARDAEAAAAAGAPSILVDAERSLLDVVDAILSRRWQQVTA